MSLAIADDRRLEAGPTRGSTVRAVLALSRVEGRRLIGHPAFVVAIALAVVETAPFLISGDYTTDHDVGWLLQVPALMISFGALLAGNFQALKSRRDGSEELFRAAPLSPAARTVALAVAGVWAMAALVLLLVAGDVAIRATGKGAATDSGRSLFPLFELVQAPLVGGLFVIIGITVARWLPRAVAGPVAVVALFVGGNSVLDATRDAAWFRLTPFHQRFLDDGGALMGFHVLYLGGLATVAVAVALLRHGSTRAVRTCLFAGLAVLVASGTVQVLS